MCGICGYITRNQYHESLLNEMSQTMVHRGPNDAGTYRCTIGEKYHIGMAHRRLSILDLSNLGHQPMFTEDGSIGIVYNGEIYNFKEIRSELEKKGYIFKSNCDTEVILYAYKEYGLKCFQKLNGMFAMALCDMTTGKVILARDRVGKKPLYYYIGTNSEFVFGSELKPILKFPDFHKEIRTEVISRYLCDKFISAPNTIFENTYKVEPGQYIIWENGNIEKAYYWDIAKQYMQCSSNMLTDYAEAKNGLKDLLYDSVEKRLVADVPVGAFLSGGIDSTLVTAVAQDVLKKPVKTFTIGFETKKENEAQYAKEIAQYIGTDHTELYISEKELFEQIKDLVIYYDEPFADSSQIPTMLVSKLAKKDTTVSLSGDGGDELFCGYTMYDWALWAQKLDKISGLVYNILQSELLHKGNISDKLPDKMAVLINNRNRDTKVQLFSDIREKHTTDMVLGDSIPAKYVYEKELLAQGICADNWQMRKMLIEMKYNLPDDMLTKVDRASMKYSLEVRCPILDYRIIEYSFRMPHSYKYKNGDKKHILKDLTYDFVPKKLLDRPKQGFGVPLEKWMQGALHTDLLRYADKNILKKQSIFNPEKIWEFIICLEKSDKSLYNSVLWSFYVFQIWYQEYVEDLWEIR